MERTKPRLALKDKVRIETYEDVGRLFKALNDLGKLASKEQGKRFFPILKIPDKRSLE